MIYLDIIDIGIMPSCKSKAHLITTFVIAEGSGLLLTIIEVKVKGKKE